MTAPQRLTDRKREAIVQAAIAEFRANGFEVTSMDKIAATAGVSKRTVYNHFPSKEELFAEILHQFWAESAPSNRSTYNRDQPLREQLRQMLQAKMQMMADENFLDLARVAIAATIHSPERAQDMVDAHERTRRRLDPVDSRRPGRRPTDRSIRSLPRIRSKACSRPLVSGRRCPWAKPPLDADMQNTVIESALDMFLACYQL